MLCLYCYCLFQCSCSSFLIVSFPLLCGILGTYFPRSHLATWVACLWCMSSGNSVVSGFSSRQEDGWFNCFILPSPKEHMVENEAILKSLLSEDLSQRNRCWLSSIACRNGYRILVSLLWLHFYFCQYFFR